MAGKSLQLSFFAFQTAIRHLSGKPNFYDLHLITLFSISDLPFH